jgi:photosystem II stability/assembly factor-like uncharacterized protein
VAGSLYIQALSFVDADFGWALGAARDPGADPNLPVVWTVLLKTEDGGRHWRLVPAPSAVPYPNELVPSVPDINGVAFSSRQDGVLTGSQDFVTHDGGLTWQPAAPDERLAGRVALAAGLFQLRTEACTISEMSTRAICEHRLWTARDGAGWEATDVAFEARAGELVAGSDLTAWIVYYTEAADGFRVAGHVLRTTNGGQSWQPLADLPASTLGPNEGYQFRPVDERVVWLADGDGGAGSFGGKTVFVSEDGGETWDLRANVSMIGDDVVGETCTGCGYLVHFTAVSEERAFMGLGRGGLIWTRDGGRTWREAISYLVANPNDGTVGPIYFVDELHGWVVTYTAIFRTVDGGETWEFVGAPEIPGFPPLAAIPKTPIFVGATPSPLPYP